MKNKKIVLVTGGTSGIGKAIADKLLEEEYIVIINSNNDYNAENLLHNNTHFFKADISNKNDLLSLKEFIVNNFGRLDCLVANAGVCPKPCGIKDITDDNIDRTIDVNLKGTFHTLNIFGNLIKDTSNNGSVVAITSVDGIIGEPYGVIYSATKAGIISLTKSFARYFNNPIVRVNAIAPGLIDTPLTTSTGEDPSWTTDVSVIKRIGKPEEIANTVAFLLSDKASFITGQTIAVDGGFTLK